ncbi:MAG: DUF2066 domain-containing protein [Idiomarina sp.]|nr:DUF2066 domain-containing protein [Idiomarina sp.]
MAVALSFSALAQDDNGMARLLEARVAVESQTNAQRQQALRRGFGEVLVRVSGHADVLERPAIRSELARANDYVIQFGYQTDEGRQYLRMNFNEDRVMSLLRQSGATIWSARRPELLLWVAETDRHGLQLLGREQRRDVLAGMMQQAQQRGLPVMMPLLDLDDRLAIRANDVWGRFEGPVLEASRRYPVNGSVMIRLQETDDIWRAEWTLLLGNFRVSGRVEDADEREVGVKLANQLAERVASEYAVNFDSSETSYTTLRMLNLHSLENVLAAEQLLNRLGPVVRVTMTRYHRGTAEFTLTVIGEPERVAQALELERRIQRIEDPWSRTVGSVLEYRWLR